MNRGQDRCKSPAGILSRRRPLERSRAAETATETATETETEKGGPSLGTPSEITKGGSLVRKGPLQADLIPT